MKKAICVLLIIFFMTGCSDLDNTVSQTPHTNVQVNTEFSLGAWLSFNEINELLANPLGFKAAFQNVVKNLKALNITDLYFHVRSHCDSVVKSDYFPQTESSKMVDFDILSFVITACHRENIKVYAWINPYRVSSSHSDITQLSENSPALKWINTEKVIIDNGIYLNPAEGEVRRLIINGITELIGRYDIDGIHFDDYFYPTTDESFDKISYEAYKSETAFPLELSAWRRANVDILISDCNIAIKNKNENLIFSISPAADINKNYNTYYADISWWCSRGLIDEVIPQLYFGFNHSDPEFCFEQLLAKWVALCEKTETKLKIGLAAYKVGTSSLADGDEWLKSNDILARQIKVCKNNANIKGACFFSYSSLFSENTANQNELNNIKALF